jgi:hypothetical protein
MRADELFEGIGLENSHPETTANHHVGELFVRHNFDVMPLGPEPMAQSRVRRNRAECTGGDDLDAH